MKLEGTFLCCNLLLMWQPDVWDMWDKNPDLLLVGEGLHGAEQLIDGGAEQVERQSLHQLPGGQGEHAGGGHQVDVQWGGVALHPTQHQLEETTPSCCTQTHCLMAFFFTASKATGYHLGFCSIFPDRNVRVHLSDISTAPIFYNHSRSQMCSCTVHFLCEAAEETTTLPRCDHI